MEKRGLRQEMLARRAALAPAERERCSLAAAAHLTASPWFAAAATVLLYVPIRGEVATAPLAAAARAAGKRLALPRVQQEPRRLVLHAWSGDPADLVPGAYQIPEPAPDWPVLAPGQVDLVVVPGVAFDRTGLRLGYGGGYYDRLLPEIRAANPAARFVGLAYGFQVVEALPAEPHDVRLDGVAMEAGLQSSAV